MAKFLAVLIMFQFIVTPCVLALPGVEAQKPSAPTMPSTQGKAAEGDQYRVDPNGNVKDHAFDPAKLLDFNYVLKNLMEKHTLSMALSATGTTFDLRCPEALKYLSTWTYKTASLVHVGQEIFNANALSQNHKRKTEDLKLLDEKLAEAKAKGEIQRESLMMTLDEEQETLRYTREKKKWMTGIMGGQLAATGFALAESLLELAQLGAGGAAALGLGTAAAAGTTSTTGYYGVIAAPMIVWTTLMATIGGVSLKCVVNPVPPVAVGAGIVASYAFMKNDPHYQEFGAFLTAHITGISAVTPIVYDFAITRSVAFGAHTLLTKIIVDELTEQEKVLEANIKKLQDVLASLGPSGNEPGPSGVGGGGNANNNEPPKGHYGDKGKRWYGTHGNRQCMSSGEGGTPTSSSDCKSPMKIGQPAFNPDLNLPVLSDSVSMLGNTAQAVVSGEMEKGAAMAAQLGSQAGKIKALNDEMKKRINNLLKEKGKNPVDFDKEEKDMLSYFRKEAVTAGGKQYTPPTTASAGYRATLDQDTGKAPDTATKTEIKAVTADAAPAVNPLKGIGRGYKDISPVTAKESDYSSSGTGIDEFETDESDIAADKQVSIFKIISHRYNLSYERLLNRKRKD